MRRSFASLRLGALALAAVVAFPVAAQFRKPEAAIAYRRGAMTVMSAHFYRAAAMAYGRVPFDAKAVADNLQIATYLSKLPFAGFAEASDKGNPEAPPKGGDIELIRGQVGVTEKACKTCHDAYTKE